MLIKGGWQIRIPPMILGGIPSTSLEAFYSKISKNVNFSIQKPAALIIIYIAVLTLVH